MKRPVRKSVPALSTDELLRRRLHHLHLTTPAHGSAAELVRKLGAVQAQEFAMAKWALGLRLPGATEAEIGAAFDRGDILRTHVLRPTWHFVAPEDLHWLQELTADRVRRLLAGYDRKLGIDASVRRRAARRIGKLLRERTFATREEIAAALAADGISATSQKLGHLVMHAELDALVCSGPRRGKQFTYALTAFRAPAAGPKFSRESALAELARRYFASRGAATAHDFAWWSGLTVADARDGVASLGAEFSRATVDGVEFVLSPETAAPLPALAGATLLLPDYDEYGISYEDRAALRHPRLSAPPTGATSFAFNRMVVVDGRILGSWQRTLERTGLAIRLELRAPLTRAQIRDLRRARQRLAEFIGVSLLR